LRSGDEAHHGAPEYTNSGTTGCPVAMESQHYVLQSSRDESARLQLEDTAGVHELRERRVENGRRELRLEGEFVGSRRRDAKHVQDHAGERRELAAHTEIVHCASGAVTGTASTPSVAEVACRTS
jgi:hypothetical protein